MINKQNLWFLTIFSLILVLCVYYITMPNEMLIARNKIANNKIVTEEEKVMKETNNEMLVTMRTNLNEKREEETKKLKQKMASEDTTNVEKNNAFEEIKKIANLTSAEETLEKNIKKQFSIDCFIEINGNKIMVTAINKNHNIELANKIMQFIQKNFDSKMLITIKFEK